MNTLQSLGLTREAVARIAATFPPPRTGDDVSAPEGKRGEGYRCVVLAALLDGEKTTTELATAAGTDDEGIRLVLRRLAEAGKVIRTRPGKPGVDGWPAKWRLA